MKSEIIQVPAPWADGGAGGKGIIRDRLKAGPLTASKRDRAMASALLGWRGLGDRQGNQRTGRLWSREASRVSRL